MYSYIYKNSYIFYIFAEGFVRALRNLCSVLIRQEKSWLNMYYIASNLSIY